MLNISNVTLLIFFSLIISFCFPSSAVLNAQTKRIADISFEKCAVSPLIEDGLDRLSASDNDSIYLTSQHQKLLSFDRPSLALNWKSDFGGVISHLVSLPPGIFLVTGTEKEKEAERSEKAKEPKKVNEGENEAVSSSKDEDHQINKEISKEINEADKSSESSGTERALERELTGSFIWLINRATGLPLRKAALRMENVTSLFGVGEKIVLIGSDGSISVFDSQLNLLGENKVGILSDSTAVINFQDKLLVSSGSMVWSYSLDSLELNQAKQVFAAKEPVNILAAIDNDQIIYGDKKGDIISQNLLKNKVGWKYRAGAGILSITISNGGILINSADNFIYMFSRSGSLKWKKRFKDSPGKILADGNLFYLLLDQEGVVFVIDSDSGKDLTSIDIPEPERKFLSIFLLTGLIEVPSRMLALQESDRVSSYSVTGHCH